MRKYIEFTKKCFQRSLTYRINYFTSLSTHIVLVCIYIAIWSALYANKAQVEGISLKEMITYAVLSVMLSKLFITDNVREIQAKVRSGEIATDLMKPIDIQLYLFFSALGTAFFNILMIILPIVVISFLFLELLPPASFLLLLYCLIGLGLGFLIVVFIDFIIGMISFWTISTWGFNICKSTMILFFAGVYVPLWFFPEKLRLVAEFLPFRLICFLPLSIYLGKTSNQEILSALLQQLGWVIFFIVMGRLVLKAVVKKVTIQGG